MNPSLKRKFEHQKRMQKLMNDRAREERELEEYQASAKAKAIDAEIHEDMIDAFLALESLRSDLRVRI